ncbi:glycosyltransferase family 4 protein [Pedobacter psychroterrae]|uniref:Glycosyltransferase family 4 protein n=2 Tax=Pedobacter psychroterrae TaxID=2530453 RepID=A0A4R0NB80_9SPHI|nr:glycosyltransferase family 4 protein [Pedobacter psychroterrae]
MLLCMMGYFWMANKYNIIDKPNERGSHSEITIRGGGIIYLVGAMITLYLHFEFWTPILSFFIIGIISFIDDIITLSSRIRIIFHLTGVTLLFYYMNLFAILPWWATIFLYIFVIGIINAYNFMDGINGITGANSLVVLSGLQYVNLYVTRFIHPDLIWFPILASIVFLFFNFRNKAKCFAGDVGSVTVALWICFLLMKLIFESMNYALILFLAVYGVDTILTIVHRLMLRQNIFQPHRLHFYQILTNERKIPHLIVSSTYALIQLVIIILVIFSNFNLFTLTTISIVPLGLIYVLIKPRLMSEDLTHKWSF